MQSLITRLITVWLHLFTVLLDIFTAWLHNVFTSLPYGFTITSDLHCINLHLYCMVLKWLHIFTAWLHNESTSLLYGFRTTLHLDCMASQWLHISLMYGFTEISHLHCITSHLYYMASQWCYIITVWLQNDSTSLLYGFTVNLQNP